MMINEKLLSYIWQFQKFETKSLTTIDNQRISVLKTGVLNVNSGPDFLQAHVQIGELLWVGTIEIHVKSSDWYKHSHEDNPTYETVVLHLVWENDLPDTNSLIKKIPHLVIKDYVQQNAIEQYLTFINTNTRIPCEKSLASVSRIHQLAMLERMIIERFNNKASKLSELWSLLYKNWHEVTWQLTARYFGTGVNAAPMVALAERLSLTLLLKHRDQPIQVEALLFGTSGLLPSQSEDEYVKELITEFNYLKIKYNLTPIENTSWHFARMRPFGFPTVRIAQLAQLIISYGSLFDLFIEESSIQKLCKKLQIPSQTPYWQTHFQFHKTSNESSFKIGKGTTTSLLINVVAPLRHAWKTNYIIDHFLEQEIQILEDLPAEDNSIIRMWKELGITPSNAADSQGLIELYSNYCTSKRCLHCIIGHQILKN